MERALAESITYNVGLPELDSGDNRDPFRHGDEFAGGDFER